MLTVIPHRRRGRRHHHRYDTIYGLSSSVFTEDVDRARALAAELRAGTVGHNAFRTDFGIAFGGFKQSGQGREGGSKASAPTSR